MREIRKISDLLNILCAEDDGWAFLTLAVSILVRRATFQATSNRQFRTIFVYFLRQPLSAASVELQLVAPNASQSWLDDVSGCGDGCPRPDCLYLFKYGNYRRE